jgi:chromosome segregation ATPase
MADPRELAEQAFGLFQEALRDSDARVAELSEQLNRRGAPDNELAERLETLTRRLEQTEAECARWKLDAVRLEEMLAAEKTHADRLKSQLDAAEPDPAAREPSRPTLATAVPQDPVGEIESLRRELDEALAANGRLDERVKERDARVAQLSAELEKTRTELDKVRSEVDTAPSGLDTAGSEVDTAPSELEKARSELDTARSELDTARSELEKARSEVEKARAESNRQSAEADEALAEAQRLASRLTDIEAQAARAEEESAELERRAGEMQARITELEAELREERECTANLTEVANERRETVRTLQDRLEEAEEHYEEAKWRLGKAKHFERLVRRRKSLIAALIKTIRAKSKANIALKAGLDGLRTYKAAAEAKQHQLLGRIDRLKAKLKEQEETLAQHQTAMQAKPQSAESEARLAESEVRVAELESRLNLQAELVQNLEDELKDARGLKQSDAAKTSELKRLNEELEAKSQIIEQFQHDANDQQRKLAKLRGSESETLRLKALSERNQSLVDSLQRENARLRSMLEGNETSGAYGNVAEK